MISILMPLYNGLEFLCDSIPSVINQTFNDWELLIGINGHNYDEYINIVDKIHCFNDSRIQIIFCGEASGKSKTLNALQKVARHNYIALLDVDDIWLPEKLEQQMLYIKYYDIIGSDAVYIGERDGYQPGLFLGSLSCPMFSWQNPVINSAALLKKSDAYWDENWEGLDDYNMWIELLKLNKTFYNVPKILIKHRIHKASYFNNKNDEMAEKLKEEKIYKLTEEDKIELSNIADNKKWKICYNNLILGSSGFVGKYLCQYLRDKNENVVEFDIVRNEQEDCRTDKLPLKNIDRVYFLAWQVGGSNYLYDPQTQKEQLDWNSKILSNCMDQLQNIPFVFVSSQLAENNETVYGVLKRLGEHWTTLNGGTSVRLWNVYGSYEDSTIKSHVVADFIHQAINAGKIIMQTNGEEKRQFIYIEDVCNALYSAFDYRGVFDASTLHWNSIYDVATIIKNITNCEVIRGEKTGSSLIIGNKETVPNWSANTNLEIGLMKTISLFTSKK